MADRHLTPELFWAAYRQERSRQTLVRRGLAHLRHLCGRCREELRAAGRHRRRERAAARRSYAESFRRALARLEAEQPHRRAETSRARDAFRALLALPPARRGAAVHAEPERYRGRRLADLLLEESRRHLPGDPRQAGELAVLARAVLQQSDAGPETAALYARAVAYQGNSRRIAGRLAKAESLFSYARFLSRSQADVDPLVGAELDLLESSLRRAQRRLPEALRLLVRALGVYQRYGTDSERARALIKLGYTWREAHRPLRAIAATEQALALLAAAPDPLLVLMARHNLAQFQCDLGRFERARQTLAECRQLYRRFPDPSTQLRRRWLEASVARGRGETGAAEATYRAVRQGFLREGIPYNAALVSLDLAALYLEQGRTGEVRALAEELLPLFEAQGVHREAAAALLLFVEAARAERLTLAWLRRLGRYLEAARQNPELVFRERP